MSEAPSKQTVAVNHRGEILFRSPDLLTQLKEGRDFYVGQKRYVVLNLNEEDGLLTIRLQDPELRCPYRAHHQPCECDGMAGDR